jgi:hypothetical protein
MVGTARVSPGWSCIRPSRAFGVINSRGSGESTFVALGALVLKYAIVWFIMPVFWAGATPFEVARKPRCLRPE